MSDNNVKLEIELPASVGDKISEFWRLHGRLGASMLSQPIARNGKYTLRIKMLSPEEAERIAAACDAL